jgi:quercetin dioxygenase-like cupin family protein
MRWSLVLTLAMMVSIARAEQPAAAWHSSGCKGEEIKVLMGCPFDQASQFTMRVRLQKGLKLPSHSYPVDIGVTVLRGVLNITFSQSGKPRTVTLRAGDFFKVPAYAFHTAEVLEETELQDNGIGPVVVTWEHAQCSPTPAPDPLQPFCAGR